MNRIGNYEMEGHDTEASWEDMVTISDARGGQHVTS
jgi:hypothetical protein